MKKLATLVMALIISGFAFGQDRQQRGSQKSPEESAKLYTEKLTKELNLSSEQQKQIYDLTLEQAKKAKDRKPMQREKMNKDNMEKFRAERKAHQDKMESILTPEQLQTWKAARESAMKNRGAKMKRGSKMNKNADSLKMHKQKRKESNTVNSEK